MTARPGSSCICRAFRRSVSGPRRSLQRLRRSWERERGRLRTRPRHSPDPASCRTCSVVPILSATGKSTSIDGHTNRLLHKGSSIIVIIFIRVHRVRWGEEQMGAFLNVDYDALHFHTGSLKSTFSKYSFGREEGSYKKRVL